MSLEDWKKGNSSTYRELRSVESGLELIGPEARGKVVRYGNDNYTAVRVVVFGYTKEDCHAVVKRRGTTSSWRWCGGREIRRRSLYVIRSARSLISVSTGLRKRVSGLWRKNSGHGMWTGLFQIGARGFKDLSVNTGQWGVSIQMLSL